MRDQRTRALRIELLEARTVMTALPFGATPDDTGEFMLGDVHVTVVLMESSGATDNGTITYSSTSAPPSETINYTPEDWSSWTLGELADLKQRILDGVNWWKQSLDALPAVRDGLLNFTFDWTRFDAPVPTPYEPIARRSEDVERSGVRWIDGFLQPALVAAGLSPSGSVSADMRKFNNYQRQQNDADWAFTIIVVNNKNDLASDQENENIGAKDKGGFAVSGQFQNAFSFAGGRYMVVPASRPDRTFAHETGHMFWALDEYEHGGTSNSSRGYYNTPNANAWDNPEIGFAQQPSIMTNDVPDGAPPTFLMKQAFDSHVTSASSAAMIGWQDSDGDGLFDVLDVPFELSGTGRFESSTGIYRFTGDSSVRTLPNLNPTFLQNDITINRIREVQYSIDNGPWHVAQSYPERTYKVDLDLSIADSALASAGSHTIKIRTIDTRTGAMSPEFVGNVSASGTPQSVPSEDAGASGYVYFDNDGDGSWDKGEAPLGGWNVGFVDQFGTPISLEQLIDPDDYQGQVLNSVHPDAELSVIGSDAIRDEVQELTISLLIGATVTPAFNGVLGTPLVLDALLTPAEVLASLSAIPELAGNIQVSYGSGFGRFLVTFTGALAAKDVPLITQGAETGGGSLIAVTKVDAFISEVHSQMGPVASATPYVYANYSISLSAFTTLWNTGRRFKAEFVSPVSSVSLQAMYGGFSAGVARLEGYSADGVLLERYTTGVLTSGESEVMSIERPTPDIAYVVAYGHLGSNVGLEELTWGPQSSVTTNALGAWSVPSLLTGTYHVKVMPPAGHIVTMPQGGQYDIAYTAGQAVGDLNFGVYNTDNIWHNIALPANVNYDARSLVNSLDILVIINWLTLHGHDEPLPPTGNPLVTGFLDVNGDKKCSITDVLNVVNYITLHPPGSQTSSGGGGAGSGQAFMPTIGTGGGGVGSEGETVAQADWIDLGTFQVSPEYLDSREDFHSHDHADNHAHHYADPDLTDDRLAGSGSSAAISSTSAADGLTAWDVNVDGALAGLSGDHTNGLLVTNLLRRTRTAESGESGLTETDNDDAIKDEAPWASGIRQEEDREGSIMPLARRKRLEQAIDALAEDVGAAASEQLQKPARITRRDLGR